MKAAMKGDIDDILLSRVREATNAGRYSSALIAVATRLRALGDPETPPEIILQASLAGWLVDIGMEGSIPQAIHEGLKIFVRQRVRFEQFLLPASIHYNIGNAHLALQSGQRPGSSLEIRVDNIKHQIDAKREYALALRSIPDGRDSLYRRLTVNYGNVLSACLRVPEAINMYDSVLREEPDHPEANIRRAGALRQLATISKGFSTNQIWQTILCYERGAKAFDRIATEKFVALARAMRDMLRSRGVSQDDLQHDIQTTETERKQLSAYRLYCIDAGLALCEHAIYCSCIGTRKDDLRIPPTNTPISGRLIPRMELYLNRAKTEFALARLAFYQGAVSSPLEWNLYQEEVSNTDLLSGDLGDLRLELVRTSFRLCFGILDKIAAAICELFELADQGEHVYFESFWKPRKTTKERASRRWERLCEIDNPSLVALYSIATDLHPKEGDWPEYKIYRNAMEHGLLLVTNHDAPDPLKVVSLGDYVVSLQEFHRQALHLLRLTRSAIFSFVYCVRHEGAREVAEDGRPFIFGD